jgi:hypothetical protein
MSRIDFLKFFWVGLTAAACSKALPPSITPAITQTLDVSPIVLPTVTETPTITPTFTETRTPTETAVPRPDYYRGLPAGIEEAVFVTDEQIQLIKADALVDQRQLNEPYPSGHGYRITPFQRGGDQGIYLNCAYGESCAVYTLVQKKDPHGGDNIYLFIWKFRDPDGTISVVEHELVGFLIGSNTEAAKEYLLRMQYVKKSGQTLTIMSTTHLGVPESDVEPCYWDTANGAPEESQRMFQELQKDPEVFPDGIENVPLNGSIIV